MSYKSKKLSRSRLPNYNKEEAAYDSIAYTFSSAYHDGQLKLYTHLMTASKVPGSLPKYHMTLLDSWGTAGNANTFQSGATAF